MNGTKQRPKRKSGISVLKGVLQPNKRKERRGSVKEGRKGTARGEKNKKGERKRGKNGTALTKQGGSNSEKREGSRESKRGKRPTRRKGRRKLQGVRILTRNLRSSTTGHRSM